MRSNPIAKWAAKSYVKVTLFFVQAWVNLRILKQKRLFEKKNLGIVFIGVYVCASSGNRTPNLGLKRPVAFELEVLFLLILSDSI